MAASVRSREAELITGINVTPLVDVVLVLLIVLMVTAQYVASQAIPINLPRAQSGEGQPMAALAISIDPSGNLFLDGERLSRMELQQRLRARHGDDDRTALIRADGSVPHRAVVSVIDLLRSEGITKLALNVAPERP